MEYPSILPEGTEENHKKIRIVSVQAETVTGTTGIQVRDITS
jgi:hypothetical protein